MSLTFTPVEGGSVRDPWLFPCLLVFLLSYLPRSPGVCVGTPAWSGSSFACDFLRCTLAAFETGKDLPLPLMGSLRTYTVS